MEDYKKKYEQALDNFKKIKDANKDNNELVDFIEYEYPELKESEDEKMREMIIQVINITPATIARQYRKEMLDWLEKQGVQKQVPITDKWIEDYWKHHKVTNPNSYDKGDEVQFDHDGFVRFCNKYFQKPTWSEEDEHMLQKALSAIRYVLSIPADKEDDPCFFGSSTIAWLKSLKERMKGE